MKFFKKPHIHYYQKPPEVYREAFQKIIVEHQVEAEITLYCSCGDIKKCKVSVGFNLV